MSLSRVGGSSAAATSIAIPAHQAGDLIVIWAYRDGSTTPPTVPAAGGTVPTFTTIDGPTGANSNSAVCAWAVAAGTTDTSGTWTNATGISVEVWRGAPSVNPIGGHAQSGGSAASGANMAVPAITLTDPSSASAILAFAGHQNVTAWSAAPSGWTQQSQVATECEALSKNTTTSGATFNVTCTASATGGYRTQQIEIIADLGDRVSQVAIEVVDAPPSQARVSQVAIEALQAAPPTVSNRVSQIAIEVLSNIVHAITATIAGTSSLTASIGTIFRRFTASISGTSSLTVSSTTSFRRFTASIAGSASFSATLRRVKAISATIVGTSSLAATTGLAVLHRFTASIAGTGSLTAVLRRVNAFVASIAGAGSLSATVSHPSGGPHTFTATISGHGTLHVQPRLTATSGVIVYAADAPTVYPLLATNALVDYAGDEATLFGALQPDSGVILYKGDAPHLAGAVFPSSGVFRYAADAPHLWASFKPPSGRILYKGDAPNIFPLSAQSGKVVYKGDHPTIIPVASAGGRFRYAGDGPVVYPLQAPSGIFIYKAGTPAIATASIILNQSGIIRWRADVPIVTPLTEPVNPPPVSGTGLKIEVVV